MKIKESANDELSLLEQIQNQEIEIDSACEGNASCGTCRIILLSDQFSEETPIEKEFWKGRSQKKQERLSCQTYCLKDSEVLLKS